MCGSRPDPVESVRVVGTRYMDIWTREEMQALKERCYGDLSEDDYKLLLERCVALRSAVNLTLQLVTLCCIGAGCRYGPVPRWVLEQTRSIDKEKWFERLDKAVESKDAVRADGCASSALPLQESSWPAV